MGADSHGLKLLLLSALFFLPSCSQSQDAAIVRHTVPRPVESAARLRPPSHRGWNYLVERLKRAGVPEADLYAIYSDPRMPEFTSVPFSVAPKETKQMYSGFGTPSELARAREFLNRNAREFRAIEELLGVDRNVITAIMLVETHLGQVTGRELVLNRLSRVASVRDPRSLIENFKRLHADDPSVTLEKVEARGRYLEDTFLPELVALFRIARETDQDIFTFRGSIAGAFGYPQFLPSAYLRYGYDGNGDGIISLFNEIDAIWSVGQYFVASGWHDGISYEEKRAVVWKYNHSEPYIDTVLRLAVLLRSASTGAITKKSAPTARYIPPQKTIIRRN